MEVFRVSDVMIMSIPGSAMYIQHFGSTRLSQDSVLSVSHEGEVLQGICENVAMMGPL